MTLRSGQKVLIKAEVVEAYPDGSVLIEILADVFSGFSKEIGVHADDPAIVVMFDEKSVEAAQ